jgi:phospholipid/cholesterol/gamma-HCH transport system substrate-binding protein
MIENKTTLFDYTRAEIVAGLFVILGLAALGYLSTTTGGLSFLPRDDYHVRARFSNVGDLKVHAPVKIAGVTIGRVDSIRLAEFVGEAQLGIGRSVHLPKDTIASITTAGLLGDAYVALSPGGSDEDLKDGDRIGQTEPALNMADLVGRAAFGTSQAPARGGEPQEKGNKGEPEEPALEGKPPAPKSEKKGGTP